VLAHVGVGLDIAAQVISSRAAAASKCRTAEAATGSRQYPEAIAGLGSTDTNKSVRSVQYESRQEGERRCFKIGDSS
jgi:hypothetical protein